MKKIGIATIHSDLHYGAALQAYALCAFLRRKGYNAFIINYIKKPNIKNQYSFPYNIVYKLMNFPRYIRYRKFLSAMVTTHKYKTIEDFQNISEDYDILCTGSDQVWNPLCSGINAINPVYFLDTYKKYKKIAYAASLGAYKFNEAEKNVVSKLLNDYDHISVREEYTKEEVKRISNYSNEIPIVVDPTLLLDQSDWGKIANNITINQGYILIYYLDNLPLILECANYLKKQTGWQIIMMSNKFSRYAGVDKNIPFCGPREFLGLIKSANYILTDSFHGTAFSINFRKNFASILKKDNPYRAISLLEKSGLKDRLINNIQDFSKLPIKTDYSNIQNLYKHINESKNILLDFIEK